MANKSVWRLNYFGGLRATTTGNGDGTPKVIERFRTQKTASLLALLAIRGPQSREDVCALLWPDASPETARNSLSVALSSLRRELGNDALIADRQQVALAPQLIWTDVNEFDTALSRKEYSRAVEIFQGSFLPGFHEEPFLQLAAEYEEKARGAFKARLDELEAAGEPQATIELTHRATTYFGKDERWFLALMRAYQANGDLDAALRTYERLQRWARKNGEVASDTARALAKTIRREKETKHFKTPGTLTAPLPIEAKTSSATQLPTQWTRFFGREAERDLLRGWLEQGEKLITLSGAGGSGKTRLAIETLRETAPQISANFCFVPLASIMDADLIFPSIRDALGWTASPELPVLEQLGLGLATGRWILLLDNFEQLAVGGASQLQALRERLPKITLLVTSRILLNLPGEREFSLAPLPTPLSGTQLEQMGDYPSVELFCDRANIQLTNANIESIGALCRRMDGIPLALELAAARARVLSPAQILEKLERHPDLLRSREHGVPARHQTLRATIEWSTDLLPTELHDFFLRLSVFRGGWTVESAEAVCNEPDALDALTQLRESSLVRVVESEEGLRFRMLETLREFAQEKLTASQREDSQRQFFDYFLSLAQQAAGEMQGPGQTKWLSRLDTEQDNLRAALNWARQHDARRGLLLATALVDFWEKRLNLKEGRHWIETFLNATNNLSEESTVTDLNSSEWALRARALGGAGRLAWHGSDFAASRALVQEGLDTARQSGDVASFIYAVAAFVRFAMTTGDDEGDVTYSRALSEEAVALSHSAGDDSLLLEALIALNYARLILNDLPGVRATHEEAIAIARRLGDEGRLASSLTSLASLDYYQGHYEAARVLLDESIAIARRLGAPWDLIAALWTVGLTAREQNQLEVAQAALHEVFEICRENPAFSWGVNHVLLAQCYLLFRRGLVRDAGVAMGAAEALALVLNYRIAPVLRVDYEHFKTLIRESLGEDEFIAARTKGAAMNVEQAIDFGLGL
jgi:predicted ATPase/DNA-binding SARP family transcriptional activator